MLMNDKQQNTGRRKVLFVAAALACMLVCVGGTAAFYSTSTTAENVITTGGIGITLVCDGSNGQILAVQEAGNRVSSASYQEETFMPGTAVERSAYVENAGQNDAWVRVAVDVKVLLADGTEGDASLVMPNYTDDWTFADGLYYCNDVLAKDGTTDPLFTSIAFSGDMDNSYQGCTITVTLVAQATQVAHNGTAATEAAGWPAL